MEILNRAIKVEGTIKNLADKLGVPSNVIGNWLWREKLPLPWRLVLESRYSKRKSKALA